MSNNSKIIACFEELISQTQLELNELKKEGDASAAKKMNFKIISYRKSITAFKQIGFEITSGSQLKDVKNIGKSTIEKVDEILTTGTCSAIKISEKDHIKMAVLKDLQRITGVGPAKAEKLYGENKYTLNDLLNMQNKSPNKLKTILTHHQLLGLKYLHDLEQRIPRSEIIQIEKFMRKYLARVDSGLKMIVCGSFRRKATSSGDIDVLIYHEDLPDMDSVEDNSYLQDILGYLKADRFLVDDLTIKGNTKYMGMCKIGSIVRRIDIRFIPSDCLGAALLYFTGSGDFNKNMRTYALKKGYTINEYGIWKSKGKKLMATKTEADIFGVLGLEYVEPWDRKSEYKFG